MRSFRVNGRNYTEFFAWFPRRMTSGELVWMRFYYIRPNRNGEGVLLTSQDLIIDWINTD